MFAWVTLALFAQVQPITVESLLEDLTSLDRLASVAPYRMAQASSYDRNAKSPTVDWFANGDAGQYIRTESNDGRKEHVMADLKGPGAVVRVWSANPSGTIRFYFDGEATPRLEVPLNDLLHGKIKPFIDPLSYEASRGCNLYFPFPYQKSLKVTMDETGNFGGLYYHVGYRTYPDATPVQTFTLDPNLDVSPYAAKLIAHDGGEENERGWVKKTVLVSKSSAAELALKGSGVIREFIVKVPPFPQWEAGKKWSDPSFLHNRLSQLKLTMTVDGETTIQAPLGDFFCSVPGLTPYESFPMDVAADGTMKCRFPMPFGKEAHIQITSTGSVASTVTVQAKVEDVSPSNLPAYRFHAQWEYVRGRTRPMRDLTYLNAKGEGRFVGVNLHIENPTPAWWGEGDEKVYVDGESFPSTFGTGTEDYFGYAWSNPATFQRPYHGQPHCTGPGTFGHDNVFRWQIFDDIPFTQSLRFDMEMWHWEDVTATWASTAFWYAKPGGTGNHAIKVPLTTELIPAAPVKGAIEGESLPVASVSGGTWEDQEGFFQLSGGKQRWWLDPKPGDTLVMKLTVPKAGRYRVEANLGHAQDYGIHEISLNGKVLGEIDFYSKDLAWKVSTLGTVSLPQGDVQLVIKCTGTNGAAAPRRMFGLDYVKLIAQ